MAVKPQPPAPPKRPAPTVPAARPRPPAAVAPLPWYAHVPPLLTLPLLALLLYWPSLDGPFVFDDPNAITQSNLIRSLWPPWDFLTLSTRPLSDYSFAIDYAIGGLDPTAFHVTSVLLHGLNGVLLYVIALCTLAAPALAARHVAARFAIAWGTAALFIAHPLASETVAYASSRSEILASTFYLLAVATFIGAAAATTGRARAVYAVLLFGWAGAGLASKEIAATLPAALWLYDWLFLAAGDWRRTRTRRWLVGVALLPLALGGLFLLIRAYTSSSPLGDYGSSAGLGFERFGRGEYLMTQFGVIAYYLRLVVLPIGQTFDYDWHLATTPLAFGVLAPLALLAALAWLAWRVRRTYPLATFALFWMLIILAPTSSVMPIADIAVERRMYLPLAGLMLLAAAALHDLLDRLPAGWRRLRAPSYAALLLVAVAICSRLTTERARLWGDAIALHEDGVAKAPGNPRVRLNLGVTYLNLGQPDKALATLIEAKALFDRHESIHAFPRIGAFIHYNLGAVLYTRGEYDRAAPELARSLELGGQYLALRPMAYMLLGRIAAQHGDWAAAATQLGEALKYQENPEWRVDLAQMQAHAGDLAAARATLADALQRYPGLPRAVQLQQRLAGS